MIIINYYKIIIIINYYKIINIYIYMNIVSVCGGDTIFPTGIPFSLVNNVTNVWGIQYSRGYRIHYDTGLGTRWWTDRTSSACGVGTRSPTWATADMRELPVTLPPQE